MSERWIRPVCSIFVLATWLVDLVTPQAFVVAIILNAPIALSSLALDVRFTQFLVLLALVADCTAGFFNGVQAHGHYDAVALANRFIAALSFLMVGGLSNASQRTARRAGELAAKQRRDARERDVRRAVETIRASVNRELIARAIVREAIVPLGVSRARLYVDVTGPADTLTYECAGGEVDEKRERPPAAVWSLLVRIAERKPRSEIIAGSDPLGRLLLDELETKNAIAAPLVEHGTSFGILVLSRDEGPFDQHFDEGLLYYVDQGAIALAQAELFLALAERNDALRERGDIIRDIVYALSHDLRTPLSAARVTMTQALEGTFGPLPSAYEDILARSIASNEELERLAETLLLVSRYESGDRSALRDDVSIGPLIRTVVGELESLWRMKHIDVRVASSGEIAVLGDYRELRRALVNLIANAITYTPSNGTIEISARANDGFAVLAIVDNGYGVPEADRAFLFQRLWRSADRHGGGSGLGLYLVRRIAEAHAGSISYAPRNGGGSTFELRLPLAKETAK